MANVLVTGGAGFIGANFVHYWMQKHPADKVITYDKLTYAGNRHSLPDENEQFLFIQGDICDELHIEEIMRSNNVDLLVHFAAESHVDRSIASADDFIQTNIVGTYSLLKAAKKIWLDGDGKPHRFHHVSTDEVYGTLAKNEPAFSESTPYAPNSPYAASKAASDHLVRSYRETYGLEVTSSNCSNNYGPYQFPEKLIPLVILNILSAKPLPIYGDGMQIRDWLYVEDHARGIELVVEKGRLGESYNIGGINEWTNIDIVNLICSLVDEYLLSAQKELIEYFPDSPVFHGKTSDSLITHVKDRAGHDRRYAINPSKCQDELNYLPQFSFEEGISKTINWYLNNRVWWCSILDGSYKNWMEYQYKER